mgnify:CR=1 FL=1
MKIFIAKSVNLLLVVGIIFVYCTQTGKIQKETSTDMGVDNSQSYFADDGIYEGSGDGFGGKIKVRLTVKDKKLQSAEILSAENETKDYLESAKKILDDAVKQQSTDVDTVSGATLSSNGIISAMKDALANGKEQ